MGSLLGYRLGGVFAKLAPITNTERDWYIFRWNLEYWSGIPHENQMTRLSLLKVPVASAS